MRARRRLRDGDALRFGDTVVVHHAPGQPGSHDTTQPEDTSLFPTVSSAQQRVLVALCRPYRDAGAFATPATNQQIAEELVPRVAAVKTHPRHLFQRFDVEQLPQNQKRARLAERALQSGLVTDADLDA